MTPFHGVWSHPVVLNTGHLDWESIRVLRLSWNIPKTVEKGPYSFQNFHLILDKCNAIKAESLKNQKKLFRDDTHMTPMKVFPFSRPPPPLPIYVQILPPP